MGDLAEVLGQDRLVRLKQIRMQVCGPQALLQLEPIPGHPLTEQQQERIEQAREKLAVELQKVVRPAIQAGEAGELGPTYDAYIPAVDRVVLIALTEPQYEAWKGKTGSPIPHSQRQAIRKLGGQGMHRAPVLRG
jgi:hypothetical protein